MLQELLNESLVKVREYEPGRWQVYFTWKNKRYFLYKNWDGTKLIEHSAQRLKVRIGYDMLQKKEEFNPGEYKHTHNQFDVLAKKWLDDSSCSSDYKNIRKLIIKNYFIPHFHKLDVKSINKNDIKKFCKSIENRSLKYQKNLRGELKGFLNWLLKEDLITKVPPFPKLPKIPELPTNSYTREQTETLFSCCNPIDAPILNFLRWTGIRPNESRGLLKKDINWATKKINIVHASSMTNRIKGTKTGRLKVIDIIPVLEECLKHALEVSPSESEVVFTRLGKRYSRKMLEGAWNAMVKEAHEKFGIPVLSLYPGTKHSLGQQLLDDEDVDLTELQALFGHADIRSTMRYARYKNERIKQILLKHSEPKTIPVTQDSHTEKASQHWRKWLGGKDSNLG